MGPRIAGVLFDWRGTLVCDPADDVWLHAAAERVGLRLDDAAVSAISEGLVVAAGLPEFTERLLRADCSAEVHRAVSLDLFQAAGMSDELAQAAYALDLEPSPLHQFFPDVPDVLRTLKDRGIGVVVLSDIHFDLRPEFAAAGLDRLVDGFVLSFEHGIQKPDAAIFDVGLGILGLPSDAVLMVGDHPRRDGGAAAVGIRTLLLPPLRECRPRGLDLVLRIVG